MSSKRPCDDMFINMLDYLEEEKEENYKLSKKLKYVENVDKQKLKKEIKILTKENIKLNKILKFGISNNHIECDYSLNQYENNENNICNWYSECTICNKFNIDSIFNNDNGIKFKHYKIYGKIIDKDKYYKIIPSILTIPTETICICINCHKRTKKELNIILLRRFFNLDKSDLLYYNLNKIIRIKFNIL